MKTKELYILEEVVKNVLTNYIETRTNDFELIYAVYREIDFAHTTREPFHEIMLNHKKYGFPPFESITRARRKVQKNHPELANKKVQVDRYNETVEYIDYAIDGYKPTLKNLA